LKTIILSAPPGWGKTCNAEALRQEFHCNCVVDEWRPGLPVTRGALHLTNVHGSAIVAYVKIDHEAGVQLVTRGWA